MRSEDSCIFCDISTESESPFDVSQLLTDEVSVMPTLGTLVPGYLLTVSNEHITSMGSLGGKSLRQLDNSLSELKAELTPAFGDYFVFEGGSDGDELECGSGSCVRHAHQHLVPASDVGEHIFNALPWERVNEYEDLASYRGEPYAYLGASGEHYVIAKPNLPGQWMRQQFEVVRGVSDWDWAIEPGVDNLHETLVNLRDTSLSQLALEGLKLMSSQRRTGSMAGGLR